MAVDVVNQYLSLMKKKDDQIESLFLRIEEKTDVILEDEDIQKNFEAVISTEFLMVKLRVFITHELSSVKLILNNNESNKLIIPIFKKREVYLLSMIQRLNELRDDLTTIQRTIYTKRTILNS